MLLNLTTKTSIIMHRLIKSITSLIINTLLISCGYTKTEDDKFPNMPVFPLHSNPEITIKPIGMKLDTLYSSGEDIFSMAVFIDNKGFTSKYIVEMNQELQITDSIPFNRDYFIAKDGHFYINDNNNNLLKYSSIECVPIKIPCHRFDGTQYKDSLSEELSTHGQYALKNAPDSLQYEMKQKIDSLSYHKAVDEFKNQVLSNLQYVKIFDTYYLLKYDDTEKVLPIKQIPTILQQECIGNTKTCFDLLNDCRKYEWAKKYISDYKNNLPITDIAVTANGSGGGNHFIPGTFYPKGFQYYDLKIEGLTTQFKQFAEHVLSRKITSRRLPGTNSYLLDVVYDGYDYKKHPTYIAKIIK